MIPMVWSNVAGKGFPGVEEGQSAWVAEGELHRYLAIKYAPHYWELLIQRIGTTDIHADHSGAHNRLREAKASADRYEETAS